MTAMCVSGRKLRVEGLSGPDAKNNVPDSAAPAIAWLIETASSPVAGPDKTSIIPAPSRKDAKIGSPPSLTRDGRLLSRSADEIASGKALAERTRLTLAPLVSSMV